MPPIRRPWQRHPIAELQQQLAVTSLASALRHPRHPESNLSSSCMRRKETSALTVSHCVQWISHMPCQTRGIGLSKRAPSLKQFVSHRPCKSTSVLAVALELGLQGRLVFGGRIIVGCKDFGRMGSKVEERGAKEDGVVKDRQYGGDEKVAGDLVRTESENKARSILEDLDPWTAWLYKPHTLVVTLIGAGLIVWASGAFESEEQNLDPATYTKRGVWAVIAVFLGYCLLQAPSTILVRPHPAFWRLVHGIAVVYLVFLTFLLFQTRDGARQFLKNLHPDLGVELQERSYGTDCRIYTPEKPNKFSNVYDTFFDEYVVAHTIGWWCKAIMIRNQPFLWFLSIAFEFCERSFIHMLPNFNECWWDSFVLDVLICNWFGIWAGMKTVGYFDGKTYNWVGVSQQKSFYDKVRRSLGQFTPAFWDKDEWNALQGPWRFLEVLACGVVILAVEVMGFFLKFILWIPPLNPLNTYRLAIWWLIANPAIREYHNFLQSGGFLGPKKLGAFCWLGISISIMEALICFKFGRGLFTDPVPRHVIWFWSTVIVGLVVFLSAWTYKNYRDSNVEKLKPDESTKKSL